MAHFETVLSQFNNRSLNKTTTTTTTTIYDILRPVYYCCLPIGLTQFNVNERKFKNCVWIIFWNSLIVISCTIFGLMVLTAEVCIGSVTAMYNVTTVVLGWVSTVNVNVVVMFGCIFRKKVDCRLSCLLTVKYFFRY